MTDRRRHPRIVLGNAIGVLRESRDVLVKRLTTDRLVALSNDPCFPGDELKIEIVEGDGYETAPVRVLTSCPVMVDGDVRYELQLLQLDSGGEGPQ